MEYILVVPHYLIYNYQSIYYEQPKRYKGLMLNMFYIEKQIGKNRIILIHMGIVNKAIPTSLSEQVMARNIHAVWRFAEFSNVCNHLLQ
jgi:hypothetical protein